MKKLIFLAVALIMALMTIAQAPQMFNYQALVRDANGNIISNQQVSFKFSILEGSDVGTAVYEETYTDVQINEYGQVNLAIGNGTTTDNFSSIDWGSNEYYLKVEMDPSNGTAYSNLGASQLLSVPYALNAGGINPDSEISLNGGVQVGSNGQFFSEIREVSDTTDDVDNYVSMILPSGYTAYNTRVLDLEIIVPGLTNTNYFGLGYTATNGTVGYKLYYYSPNAIRAEETGVENSNIIFPIKATNSIYIYYPDELKGRVFRVLLMKTYTAIY